MEHISSWSMLTVNVLGGNVNTIKQTQKLSYNLVGRLVWKKHKKIKYMAVSLH